MTSELPADMQNQIEPPVPGGSVSLKFSIWFSIKWIIFNMLVFAVSAVCVDYFIDHKKIINLVGVLVILLPITQWLILRSYGDWGLSWVLVNAVSVIILFATIALSIFLALMCFPLSVMIVIVVMVGFSAATTTLMIYLPDFPTWVPSPIINSVMSVVFGSIAFFLSIDRVELVYSALAGGFLYSIIAPGFVIALPWELWWKQQWKQLKEKTGWKWLDWFG